MDPTLISALERRDTDAARRFIEDEDDPARVLAMYHGAIRHAYWSLKDVRMVVALGTIAFAYGDPIINIDHLGLVKSIAYDVGSFCWPGWDEPGVEIDDAARHVGADAAERNLELGRRLGRPAGPLAAAHWLVGAHHLAAGRSRDAIESFDTSADLARQADDRATELLAAGYITIARREPLETEELASLEHGDELVQQLTTAARVYA